MDIFDKKKRSYIMSQIKGKNTKPELKLRKALFKLGYRYRIHDKKLPGTPDIVLAQYKTVIFVHGCFWHGHHCSNKKHSTKTNIEFWDNKIANNRLRDVRKELELINLGWQTIIVWECEIRTKDLLNAKVCELANILKRRKWNLLVRNATIPEIHN